jgi:hypothetical protein
MAGDIHNRLIAGAALGEVSNVSQVAYLRLVQRRYRCRSRNLIALRNPEFGSVLRSANCNSSHRCSRSRTGPLRC